MAEINFLVIPRVWKILYWFLINLVQNSMLLKTSEQWYVKFTIFWSVIPIFCQDLWGIYAIENSFFGIFITHSTTISNQRRLRRRQSNASEENIVIVPEFDLVIGTRLFELYLSLQEFYKLTDANRSNSSTNRIPVNHNISSSDGNTTLSSNSSSNRWVFGHNFISETSRIPAY